MISVELVFASLVGTRATSKSGRRRESVASVGRC